MIKYNEQRLTILSLDWKLPDALERLQILQVLDVLIERSQLKRKAQTKQAA